MENHDRFMICWDCLLFSHQVYSTNNSLRKDVSSSSSLTIHSRKHPRIVCRKKKSVGMFGDDIGIFCQFPIELKVNQLLKFLKGVSILSELKVRGERERDDPIACNIPQDSLHLWSWKAVYLSFVWRHAQTLYKREVNRRRRGFRLLRDGFQVNVNCLDVFWNGRLSGGVKQDGEVLVISGFLYY